MKQSEEKESRRKSGLERQIVRQLKKGMRIARDPINSLLPDLAIRQTTMYSDWYTEACAFCDLNFREEDRVRLCPKCGMAYHEDDRYQLNCWSDYFKENENQCSCGDFHWDGKLLLEKEVSPEIIPGQDQEGIFDQFTVGLKSGWKDFASESVEVLVARDGDSVIGKRCPMCRFKIRVGDRYVLSPCGCKVFFHNDLFRHLTCWNNWSGKNGKGYCPLSGKKCSVQFKKSTFIKVN